MFLSSKGLLSNFSFNTCTYISGSHDSGTNELFPSLGVAIDQSVAIQRLGNSCCGQSVIHKWAKTQNLSVREQLHAGIRYFDFRVASHPATLEVRFVHGLYGGQIVSALREVRNFLDLNPHEIIILDFNHFYNMSPSAHSMLLADLHTILGDKLVPPPFSISNYKMWGATLQALWQSPYRVIVLYHEDENIGPYPNIWPGTYIEAPWANTYSINTLLETLESDYINKRRSSNDTLYCWQGVVTPSAKHIASSPLSGLKHRSSQATREFTKWVKDKIPGPQEINICVADFVEKHDFIPTVIRLNGLIRNIQPQF